MPKCDFNKVANHRFIDNFIDNCKFAVYFQNTTKIETAEVLRNSFSFKFRFSVFSVHE